MTDILLIRHGVTSWNELRRIQGRSDTPLTPAAREWLGSKTLPAGFDDCRWYSSPLARAQETARLLGARGLLLDERLLEMDWGRWEGLTLAGMRAEDPAGFAENEARGIDFQPPGGERPVDVAQRLADWFDDVADCERGVAAVTHKGVIRAALALATGWDMREDFGQRIDWRAAHHFRAVRSGRHGSGVAIVALNLPLADA